MRTPRPGARRDHAERDLFLMIAAFAVSGAATGWCLLGHGRRAMLTPPATATPA